MRQFILRENILRFSAMLDRNEFGPREADYFRNLLATAHRELAALESAALGVQNYPAEFGLTAPAEAALFRDLIEASDTPHLVIDPRSGLHIVDANLAYQQASMTDVGKIAGSPIFDVFPDNPDLPDANGVTNLYQSLRIAAHSGAPHAMAVQRYDVRDATGRFVERYWRPLNTPIFNAQGRLAYLLHRVLDVTDEVLGRRGRATNQSGNS